MPRTLVLVENNSVPSDVRVWSECRTLREAGWEVDIVSPKGTGVDMDLRATVDGIQIHRFEPSPSRGGAAGYVREYGAALIRMTRLVRQLSAVRSYHVVHAANPPDVLLACAWPQGRSPARVFDHHDLSPELYESKFGGRGLAHRALVVSERLGFRMADVVISANESFRRIALSRGRKSDNKVFVVRNGPDPSVFRPVEPDPALRTRARHIIGYVGVIGTQDGVEDAVRALALLRAREDWHAVFVGGGDALGAAQMLSSQAGIHNRVTFSGHVTNRDDVVRAIASFDVCLSPEPRNPLNERSTFIKVAEYMSVGRPLVAFDLPETRFTARDAASYAESDDHQAFAQAIEALLDDQTRRDVMGAYGRRRVETSLSWAHSEASLLAAYEGALVEYEKRRGS